MRSKCAPPSLCIPHFFAENDKVINYYSLRSNVRLITTKVDPSDDLLADSRPDKKVRTCFHGRVIIIAR